MGSRNPRPQACVLSGRDLHLMCSPVGDRRALTREAKNVFDSEEHEHATITLRGLRLLYWCNSLQTHRIEVTPCQVP